MNYQVPILLLLAAAVLFASKKWAIVPYLIAATQLPKIPVIAFGSADLGVLRVLIALGLLRIIIRREWHGLKWHKADSLMLLWASWTIISFIGHHSKNENPITYRLGMVGDYYGFYILVRCYIHGWVDLKRLVPVWVIMISLLGAMMFIERTQMKNPYSIVGASSEVTIRNDKLRAVGPFSHPILAGTAGAAALPFLLIQFNERRRLVIIGLISCTAVVVLSNSSGPISTLLLVLMSLAFWRWRKLLPRLLIIFVLGLVFLHLIKNRPIWYLMEYVDFTGSSTGWHRAALIDAAIRHFSEWWLFGTDYTRHWLATGVHWSPDHVDMTNEFIYTGVISGFLPVLLKACLLYLSFYCLWGYVRYHEYDQRHLAFYAWCIGGALFAHLITYFSVAYYDQSYIFVYLLLGCVPGVATNHFMPVRINTT